jgi:hypothetical protein
MQNFIFCIILFFATITILGCGNGGTIITGTVKYTDGTPVSHGQIVFDNGENSYFGVIHKDGTYASGGNKTVEGIPDSSYKIWLCGTNDVQVINDNIMITPTVAEKYTSPTTTDITFEVKKGGAKTFDVVVEKPESAKRK